MEGYPEVTTTDKPGWHHVALSDVEPKKNIVMLYLMDPEELTDILEEKLRVLS